MNVFHKSPDYDQMMFHYHKLLNKDQFEDDSCYYPTMNDSRGDVATSFYPPKSLPGTGGKKIAPSTERLSPVMYVCLSQPT
jgi:hypothetical protein